MELRCGGEALTLVLQKAQGLSRVRPRARAPCSLDGHTHWSPTCRHLVLEAQLPKLQKLASVVSEHPACSDLSSGAPLPHPVHA